MSRSATPHIGFKGEANKDVLGSLEAAIARIKALDPKPAFIIHTGDITHTQKPGAFDLVTEALKGAGVERTFYIPGANDVFADGGTEYLNRFAAGRPGLGSQSFDYQGVHFVGLINVEERNRSRAVTFATVTEVNRGGRPWSDSWCSASATSASRLSQWPAWLRTPLLIPSTPGSS